MPHINSSGLIPQAGSLPPEPPLAAAANTDPLLCLGSTCLAWQADGELQPNDLRPILERLCLVDAQACRALPEAS